METGIKRYRFFLLLLGVILLAGLFSGQAAAVTGQGQLPTSLAPRVTGDGSTVLNGVPLRAVVVDPNPSAPLLRIPAPETPALLSLSAPSATFSITYVPEGSSDKFGEPCYAFPDAAKVAFTAAANIWANLITSSVPITIQACWANLGSPTILGYSGGGTVHRDFSGAPLANTFYSAALANALHGSDLDSSNADMHITYNSTFAWYYGTDGNTPTDKYDLMSVVLHEIAHGLNFAGSMQYASGQGSWGYGTAYPNVYDTFMRDGSGTPLTNYTSGSAALGSALTSNDIWFHGSNAMAANGSQRVKIYAPATWSSGSSYSHLDYATFNNTVNQLMVYAISKGESIHDPGPVAEGLFQDLGWVINTVPTLPTVTTQAVTSIGTTTATGNGTLVSLGSPNPTQYGVCWNIAGTPTTTDDCTLEGSAAAIGTFISSITGLSPATTYYVRAYATNAAGTAYGGEVSFTTASSGSLPSITTEAVSAIGTTTATGNGTVVSIGSPGATQHGVCWNTGGMPTISENRTQEGVASAGSFTSQLTGLSPNTLYYVRAYATNTLGTAYGDQVSFTTSAVVSAALTNGVPVTGLSGAMDEALQYYIAVPAGQVSLEITMSGGTGDADLYVRYGAQPTTTEYDARPYLNGNEETVTITSPQAGNWYVMIYGYAAFSGVTLQATYTTAPTLPTVSTQSVTSIAETTATGNGNISSLGSPNPSAYGICWNITGNPTTSDFCTNAGTATVIGPFAGSISGLAPSTTYYVRAYATNTAGTAYGNQVSFTTNSSTIAPTVTTEDVTSIGTASATGNGTITDLGSPTPTQHGVCWNTGGSPTTGDTCTQEGTVFGTGPFTSSINGLLPSTTYYVRAYAINTVGTSYGNQVSFATAAPPAPTELQSGVAVTNLSGAMDDELHYYIAVPAGQLSLEIKIWGGTGDADLYVRYGAQPTLTEFDARPYLAGNEETVTINNPQAGNWYIMVQGYDSFSGVSLQATYAPPVAPIVTTQAVSNIDMTTATANGTITDLGLPNPTQHGFCWNISGNPTVSDTCTQQGAVAATGAFTSPMTGLSPATTYYVRAYATNTAGTSYGSQVSFTTVAPVLPAVTTQAVSFIYQTVATANGTITDLGLPSPTQHGFCWNTGGSPTTSDDCIQSGPVSSTGPFDNLMTGLAPHTKYYVRAYAINSAGTAYGNEVSFRTAGAIELQNGVAVGGLSGAMNEELHYFITVPAGQASLEIKIWGGTGDADLYVRYGAQPTIDVYDYSPWETGNEETVTVATPQAGNWYIMVQGYDSFSGVSLQATYAPPVAPIVTTQAVSNIDMTTATANGTITDLGLPSPTQHGFCWNISGNPTVSDTCTQQGAVAATGAFTSPMTGLSPATTYYVRAYAANMAGTSYGSQVSFTTVAPVLPAVTTQAVSFIYQEVATANGTITDLGLPNLTQYGFCWNTGGSPTTSDACIQGGPVDPTGSFNNFMTGLAPHTKYYVRAYAINTVGTAYGNEVSFRTAGAIELQNGVTVPDLWGWADFTTMAFDELHYYIVVPEGQASLKFVTAGGIGNANIYVRYGAQPTVSLFDYFSGNAANNEVVSIANPQAGEWYVMVRGLETFAGVSLVAFYKDVFPWAQFLPAIIGGGKGNKN